jgi:hypothetical protein
MTKDEALRLALEALETCGEDEIGQGFNERMVDEAITAIKAALEAKDEPVPVAIVEVFGKDWRLDYMALPVGKHKLYAQQYTYTTPPQRKPLTDEEMDAVINGCPKYHGRFSTKDLDGKLNYYELVRAVEAAHGIKGESP